MLTFWGMVTAYTLYGHDSVRQWLFMNELEEKRLGSYRKVLILPLFFKTREGGGEFSRAQKTSPTR